MSREWAMPSAWTFSIKPIRELLTRYKAGVGWIDPFCGKHSPAEITNDINPERKATYNLDALDFLKTIKGKYDGLLFDPPYSFRQISEHYKMVGRKATSLDTSQNFYSRLKPFIVSLIKPNGIVISCGWNSCGMGKKYGFEIIEILLVAHGGHKNDTIVTVNRKLEHDE